MNTREFTPLSIYGNFSAREIGWDRYREASDRFSALVFPSDSPGYAPAEPHSTLYSLCLGIFCGEQLACWQYSHEHEGSILMRDTGLLPLYQKKGVYSGLLPHLLTHFTACGFIQVKSRHRFENSAAIIPKLKSGFVIVGTEIEASVSYVKLMRSAITSVHPSLNH